MAVELTIAAVRQPREEITVRGIVKGFDAKPFSIQTLRIEEPGKESYRRLVSLDAENQFELALGKPQPGSYRAGLLLSNAKSGAVNTESWLTTPQLQIAEGRPSPAVVEATQYDRTRLLLVAGFFAAVWGGLVGVCLRTWKVELHRPQ